MTQGASIGPILPPAGSGGGGGSGTVTSVSVDTNDGLSGAVANPTTTPAITLSAATQSPGDNSANVATTAFVTAAVAAQQASTNAYYASITYV